MTMLLLSGSARKYGDSRLDAALDVPQDEAVSEDLLSCGWLGRQGVSGAAAGTGPDCSLMESHLARVIALFGDTGGGLDASSGI